ncbi:protein phosphatase 2b regulatory subunit [Stylonychia lemnae]|uniref:Protein phosphatase 2b regulatory subunit n=1 Tax=Stylonychia lemnae TaxID=5949 RepID=A0A078B8F9_STYLE|nr:protein phosphatase 2b regulatory subunit [Stylonychia lemnae]|eukprot:CDW90481.1 protein phosphatase 2b regulatory subunit [Stylonychia lemnae]
MGSQLAKEQEQLKNLNFSEKELQKLYKNFSKIDKDKSGTLEPEEFFDIPELAQNPLVRRVIAVLDKNKDGNISFLEFVQGLNSLSAGASHEEKLRFAFQIYDINQDGYISNGELFTVLKMMVGNNLNDVQLQQLVDRTIIKADEDFDGKISFEEFCKMVKDLDVVDKLTINC